MESSQQLSKDLNRSKLSLWIIGLFLSWLIFSFLIWPVLSVLVETFITDGTFSLDAIGKIARSTRALKSIQNSFILAIILSFTVNIVGIFLVLVTEYFDVKGANVLRLAYLSTLVFGGILLNNGYLLVYGENGVITNLLLRVFPNMDPGWFNGMLAVVFVMTFACTSNHMIFLRNAMKSIDFQTVEAAQNMGASQGTILRKIVFPTLMPTLITVTIMTFQMGLGALSAPLMVGGEDFQTISPMILTFANRTNSRDIAAVLAIILGLAQIGLMIYLTRNERKGNYLSISKTQTRIKKIKIGNPVLNGIVHAIAYFLFLIYALPIILVILFSFMDTQAINAGFLSLAHVTLNHYQSVVSNTGNLQPFITSVVYSAVSSAVVVILMLFVARLIMKYKNKLTLVLEYAFYIPWLLPSMFIALGLILGYSFPRIWMFNYVLVGSTVILVIAYIIVDMPSTLRYLKGAYYSFDTNLEDAARNLGAGGFYTFRRVILPIVIPTALALFALNFNGKLADYDLSAFLYHPTLPTLGIVIRNNADPLASVDAKAVNLVYSVILMGINTLVLYLVYGRGVQAAESRRRRTSRPSLRQFFQSLKVKRISNK